MIKLTKTTNHVMYNYNFQYKTIITCTYMYTTIALVYAHQLLKLKVLTDFLKFDAKK